MFTIQFSEFINRPVEDVFAFVSDKENLLQVNSAYLSVKLTSDGPTAVGTTYLIVEQTPFQKVEFQYTCTTYEKNKTIAGRRVAVAAPIPVIDEYYQFEPRDQGTYVTLREELSPRGLFRLLQPIIRSMIGKAMREGLAKAKEVLESQA